MLHVLILVLRQDLTIANAKDYLQRRWLSQAANNRQWLSNMKRLDNVTEQYTFILQLTTASYGRYLRIDVYSPQALSETFSILLHCYRSLKKVHV
jgi:hypothetical protein